MVSDLATHVVIIGFIFGHMFDMILYYPEKVLERPWVLHWHKSLWRKPDEFEPSRFMPGQREQINRFAYLPF